MHVQRRMEVAQPMLCVSELCPDGEYACANQGMRAMEKYAFVSVNVNVCFYNQFVRWYTQLLVHVICNSNIINFILYFNEYVFLKPSIHAWMVEMGDVTQMVTAFIQALIK